MPSPLKAEEELFRSPSLEKVMRVAPETEFKLKISKLIPVQKPVNKRTKKAEIK
jgi:hypothetical protein